MPGGLGLLVPGDTGFYGKIPSQGDFVTRRLPGVFVQQWDDWLQRCNTHSRESLGADWARLYQNAPVWWFLLAAGTCGDSCWAGLMQPSVDRVGRHFPLTVAAELPSDLEVLDTFGAARGWYQAIEREAEAAFHPDVSLERLDARLRDLAFPLDAIVRADAADDTLPIAERDINALRVGAAPHDNLGTVQAAMREQQFNVGHSHCVWFDASADAAECTLLITKSLPEPRLSCALLDGRWEKHGWDLGRSVVRF